MKKSINILAVLLFVLLPLFYFSCKKDKPANESMDFGYNYIPDDVGSYIIYQVDSISFDDISFPNFYTSTCLTSNSFLTLFISFSY